MKTFCITLFLLYSIIAFSQPRKVHSNCTLRTEPTAESKYDIIIQGGSFVKVLYGPKNNYYFVDYNGSKGYLFEGCINALEEKPFGTKINSESEDIYSFKTENQFKEYFTKHINELDPIEGIWSVVQVSYTFYYNYEPFGTNDASNLIGNKIIIIKNDDNFIVFKKDGDEYTISDDTYESKSTPGQYFCHQFYYKIAHTMNATMNNLYSLEFLVKMDYRAIQQNEVFINMAKNIGEPNTNKFDAKTNWKYAKIFPTYNDYNTPKTIKPNPIKKTGTGFAISSNGYLVTCYHVVEDSKSIKVKGINGEFIEEYNAIIITSDKNNDLAILKINDNSFTSLGIIPYVIKTTTSDVASNIFTMGFPLTATIGDEVKYTEGSISAKSGFKGDITSYQISAAVQLGNSGGPLFDKAGNIIGVINAKHVQAENATYAVKSSYLINLIEALQTPIKLQTVNTLTGKTITDQIKLIKKFVYIYRSKLI